MAGLFPVPAQIHASELLEPCLHVLLLKVELETTYQKLLDLESIRYNQLWTRGNRSIKTPHMHIVTIQNRSTFSFAIKADQTLLTGPRCMLESI